MYSGDGDGDGAGEDLGSWELDEEVFRCQ